MSAPDRLSDRALNRALLARQGLLAHLEEPLVEVVEAIGAMQGQAWAALPVGLWSRTSRFEPADLYAALDRGELLWGIGIRGTLHLVSARQHPTYAAIAAATPTGSWHRAITETTPAMCDLREALLEFAGDRPRANDEISEFAESWVSEHPEAIDPRELEAQRSLKWRPIYRWSALVRVPGEGGFGAKTPAAHLSAPRPPGRAPALSVEDALEQGVRMHLRAFGPAAAEDVACWLGWRTPPIRELLEGLGGELAIFEDEHGRTLYDLPEAPRPDPGTAVSPRLLGAFDSTLLAYAPKRRERILPEALREVVYEKANMQIRPTILIDGLVGGIWSTDVRRGQATITLSPAGKLTRAARTALEAEGTGLLQALHPTAKAHQVTAG